MKRKYFLLYYRSIIEQGQTSARELKNENHFLKEYIHRLNAEASDYQTLHPPDVIKTDIQVCQPIR